MPIVKGPAKITVIEDFDEDDDELKKQKDYSNHRIWICKFNKVHFKRKGQFGYWYVNLDRGLMHPNLKGAYLSFEAAAAAAKTWYLIPNKEEIREEKY